MRTLPNGCLVVVSLVTLAACGGDSGGDDGGAAGLSGTLGTSGASGASAKGGAAGAAGKGGAGAIGGSGVGGTGGKASTGGGGAAGGTGGSGTAGSTGGSATAGSSGKGGSGTGGSMGIGGTGTAGSMGVGGTGTAGSMGVGGTGTAGSGTAGSAGSGTAGTGGSGTGPACNLPAGHANGSVTFYNLGSPSAAVECGFEVKGANPDVVAYVPFAGGMDFGAMNTADYAGSGVCGACVHVDRTDTGQSVDIMIVDECPSASNPPCIPGHIDLSEHAFAQLGKTSDGYLGTTNGGAVGTISWKYIACPTAANVNFKLKEPTNAFWNQILVEGHRYPIVMVEAKVNGTWMPGVRQSYNYWQIGSGNLGTAPYEVRATDVNGSIVHATLNLAAGDQASSEQFPLCQ